MPFKGQYKSPRKADLRVERLVVAIVKSKDLYDYFFDSYKLGLACRYLGISTPYLGNIDQVVEFLDSLYFSDTEKFRQFLQYILSEIMENRVILTASSEKPFESKDIVQVFFGFERVLRESIDRQEHNYDPDPM